MCLLADQPYAISMKQPEKGNIAVDCLLGSYWGLRCFQKAQDYMNGPPLQCPMMFITLLSPYSMCGLAGRCQPCSQPLLEAPETLIWSWNAVRLLWPCSGLELVEARLICGWA